MARVIAVSNNKGGSAKSTTVINVSAELAKLGQKVLAVDLDSQGHVSEGFGIPALSLEHELSDVMGGSLPLQDIVQEVRPNLSLAPANLRLSYLEPQLITRIGRENVLKKVLDPALSTYDFVLIDCPPSLGIFTVNAFAASDEVLIPMAAEFFALVGVSLLLDSLSLVRSGLSHDVGVLGIVPTRVTRTAHAREVIEQAKGQLGEHYRFFDPIPEAVAVRDASAAGVPVAEYQPASPAAKAYHELAKEILA